MKLEKNNSFEKIKGFLKIEDGKKFAIGLGLVGTLGVGALLYGCNQSLPKEKVTPAPTPVPAPTKVVDADVEEPAVVYNTPIETVEEAPVVVEQVDEKTLTELKTEFVYANIENFKKDYFETCGLEIDDNTATIILSYMNGFSAADFQVNTEDYFLSYTNAIFAYWDNIAVPTQVSFGKTNLRCFSDEIVKSIEELGDLSVLAPEQIAELNERFDIKPVKGESKVKNGDILPKYIYDEGDREAYTELSNKFVEVINLSYENNVALTVTKMKELQKFIAENWIYTGSYTNGDFNFNNVSEEIQILARLIINVQTHFMPEQTTVMIDTIAGSKEVTNYNEKLPFVEASKVKSYEKVADVYRDNDYFYQVLSINATVKEYQIENDCKPIAK